MPLGAHRELGVFKAYMFNTGILVGQFPDSELYDFLENALGMYKGMLYENVFAQIFAEKGITNYYYEPNTSSEIDFVIQTKYGITPIEIKGGLHTRSTSFDNFIKNHNSKLAIRFSKKNISQNEDGHLPLTTVQYPQFLPLPSGILRVSSLQ